MLCTGFLSAQDFAVTGFRVLEMDMDARSVYPVLDQNGRKAALIKVVLSGDDKLEFDVGMMGVIKQEEKVGEIWVYVPAGVRKITIKHSVWGVIRDYELPTPLSSAVVYEMCLSIPSKKRGNWLFNAVAGVYPDFSLGVSAGWIGKTAGPYLKVRSNFIFPSISYSCDSSGRIQSDGSMVWSDGSSVKSRFNVTAGVMFSATGWLLPYIGAGYGRKIYAIKDSDGNMVRVDDTSFSNFSLEIGSYFKISRVLISVSVASIGFGYVDGEVGVGIMF